MRWAEELSYFDFVIIYRPGTKNGKADALSRRPNYEENAPKPTPQSLLKPGQMILSSSHFQTLATTTIIPDQTITEKIKNAYSKDPSLTAIIAFLNNSPETAPANIKKQFSSYSLINDLILFEGLIYVPNNEKIKTEILKSRHNAITAGHPGQAKTLELISHDYYWPQMRKFVNRYIEGCDACGRTKISHQGPHGLLQPLPIPHS